MYDEASSLKSSYEANPGEITIDPDGALVWEGGLIARVPVEHISGVCHAISTQAVPFLVVAMEYVAELSPLRSIFDPLVPFGNPTGYWYLTCHMARPVLGNNTKMMEAFTPEEVPRV